MIDDISYFRRTVVRQIVMILFWISGFGNSIAVISWVRLFKIIFGHDLFVANSVMVTFLTGLAIGSYYFGNKIDQNKKELEIFWKLELGLGIYGLCLLLILPLLFPLLKFIFLQTSGQIFTIRVFNFLITLILLIAPSILIGAAFPVLNRFFIQSSDRVSREVGNLCFLNLFGAFTGCFLTGYFSLPILGIKQTLIFAAVLHLLNTGITRFLLNKVQPTIHLETEFYNQKLRHLDTYSPIKSQLILNTVLISLGVSGFLSLSYLLLWLKSLIYIIENDTYVFHTTLTVFLAGSSLGAFFYPRLKERKNLLPLFAIIEILIGVWGIISIILIPLLVPSNEHGIFSVNSSISWGWKFTINFCYSLLILLLPTFLMGSCLPLVSRIYLTDFDNRGKKIGAIYIAITIGAILGLNITPFLLLPYVGIQKSIIFLTLINFLIGLIVLFLSTLEYGKSQRTAVVFGSVATIFCLSLFIPSNLMLKLFEKGRKDTKIIYARESINSTIMIHQNLVANTVTLDSDGVEITSTTIDWITIQRIYGHLPLFLHHHPDTILSIGFRAGETLRSILFHPIKQLDCADNATEIVKAAPLVNANWYNLTSNPKFRLIELDGKNYVLWTDQKYDVIINAIAHPAYADNGRFFSHEHFVGCQKILKPGGIMACAIPLFKISIEDFKIMLHSFQSVFHNTTLWYPNNCLNHFAVLIGSNDPYFKINYNQISDRLSNPDIIADLAQIGLENIYEVLDCFVMGPKIIKGLTEGVLQNTDNSPHLEFSAPKTANIPVIWNQILQLFISYRESIFPYLTLIDSNMEQKDFVRLIVENYFKSTELVLIALGFELLNEPKQALEIYRQVLMMNRFDRGAKRFLDAYYDSLLVPSPITPAQLTQNATVLYQKMEYEDAIYLLNKALEINPDFAPAYFGLGINYEILSDLENARKMYQKTLDLKPNLQQAKERLDSLAVKLKTKT